MQARSPDNRQALGFHLIMQQPSTASRGSQLETQGSLGYGVREGKLNETNELPN